MASPSTSSDQLAELDQLRDSASHSQSTELLLSDKRAELWAFANISFLTKCHKRTSSRKEKILLMINIKVPIVLHVNLYSVESK